MPVEIKKLIVKAVVETPGSAQAGESNPAQGPAEVPDQEAIVKACVKQVLQILKQSKQR